MTDPLPGVWLTMWRRLPLVAAMDVMVCLAVVPALLLLMLGAWLLAMVCAVVFVGPTWAACAAVADVLVREGEDADVGARHLLSGVLTHARQGALVIAPTAALAGLTLLTLRLRNAAPEQDWLLASLAVDVIALVPTALATLPAFPLRISGGLRGRVLWRSALAVIATSPLQVGGIVAICALVWVLSTVIGGGLLFLLPGPLVLVASGTTWFAVNRAAASAESAPRR